jgi:hypothetical protein
MIVGPSPSPQVLRTQAIGTQPLPAEGETPAPSFAELLIGAEPFLTAAEELVFTSGGRDFRGTVTVGEDAIRFDARPVVAPAQLPANDTLVAPAAGSALLAQPVAKLEVLGVRTGHTAVASLPDAIRGAKPGSIDASAPHRATESERTGKAVGTPFAGAHAGRTLAPTAAARADGARQVPPAARAAVAAGQAKPPASVIVSAQDVLVVIHGIALSAAEERILLKDARELLASHGLGDRTVRVRTDTRRAR